MFHRLFGLETLSLRYFNIFGPRQDPTSPYSGVISRFATALIAGETPVIFGDGRQSRDFTYVGNVVDANLRALTARKLEGEAVNIATGRRITLRALLAQMARALGRSTNARLWSYSGRTVREKMTVTSHISGVVARQAAVRPTCRLK